MEDQTAEDKKQLTEPTEEEEKEKKQDEQKSDEDQRPTPSPTHVFVKFDYPSRFDGWIGPVYFVDNRSEGPVETWLAEEIKKEDPDHITFEQVGRESTVTPIVRKHVPVKTDTPAPASRPSIRTKHCSETDCQHCYERAMEILRFRSQNIGPDAEEVARIMPNVKELNHSSKDAIERAHDNAILFFPNHTHPGEFLEIQEAYRIACPAPLERRRR